MTQELYEILSKLRLNGSCFDFVLRRGSPCGDVKPGQFLHIACGGRPLRRPISICGFDADSRTIRIVFEVRGEGTRWLSEREPGETLDVLGPLGNGFDEGKLGPAPLLVGGGIGVPPLLACAQARVGSAHAVLGFRSRGNVILLDDFKRLCADVVLTTDDGTAGERGFVTDAVVGKLSGGGFTSVLACGPVPMLAGVARAARQNGVECFVSLEERMGCGVGACLVCACRTRDESGTEGYAHVCKHGPVFNAREVVFP